MVISDLPRLNAALDLLGLDNGADVIKRSVIPMAWEMRCRIAEDQLLPLTPDEVETLTMGEETDMQAVAKRAPVAYEVICSAFDGELSTIVFNDWQSIYDARRAESRHQRKAG